MLGFNIPQKYSNVTLMRPFSRQPLVKGERLVRHEVNAVMHLGVEIKNAFNLFK